MISPGTKLEELVKGVVVEGIEPDGPVTVVNVEWIGEDSVELFYKGSSRRPGTRKEGPDAAPESRAIAQGVEEELERLRRARPGLRSRIDRAERIIVAQLSMPNGFGPSRCACTRTAAAPTWSG